MNQLFVCEDPAIFTNPRPATPEEIIEAARIYARKSLEREPFKATHPTLVQAYLEVHFAGEEREVFACLFLDNKHNLISVDNLFYGSINHTAVYPREVAKRALYHNAAAVIATHNHPSGDATPSRADYLATVQLRDALQTLDIRLLDHIVVGRGTTYSIEDSQRLDRVRVRPENCETCGKKLIQPRTGVRKYCSAECRNNRSKK